MQDHENIKWKYFSILFILFVIILVGRLYYDYHHHQTMLNDQNKELIKDIQNKYKSSENSLVDKYITISDIIKQNKQINKLFREKNRTQLYKELKDTYELLKRSDKHLYVMHFFDTKNVTVLRMHKPESFSDDLTKQRPIVAHVNKTLIPESGFEVGKNGIVYRITTPYIVNSKHIGVLEFGIRLNYFAELIDKEYDVESEIIVKSKPLEKLSVKRNFKKIDDFSVIYKSNFFKKASNKIDITKDEQLIELNSKYYIVLSKINLKGYKKNAVAKILIAKDITDFINKNQNSLYIINSISFLISVIILLIVYFIFSKYVNDINKKINTVNNLEKKSLYLSKRVDKDNLTKAYNKNYIDRYLNSYLSNGGKGSIIFFDIDHFKECNDVHGHLVGDEILIMLSKTILKNLRTDDIFVRWGGEEFIILLKDIGIHKATDKAQRIRKIIERTKFINDITITISLGVTSIKANDEASKLINRADKLLYRAKEEGRNRVISDKDT